MRSRKTFLLCDVDLTHVFVTHGFVSKIVQLVREKFSFVRENSGKFGEFQNLITVVTI